ncbi:IclR family transcriptional regulator [Rubellimicrobium arenae]|uniref:IclR family transcriptional regulator n=1 Tax=Rubellimicrobium arenae TaxID=2817372 RepID=UPI001B304AE0|nr:IclR family transcriptional regulator [Rubellimicrobium arenae]
MAERDGSSGRSLRRAIAMVELLHERGKPLSVAEMVEALGIPKSTAYELVGVLTKAGWLAPAGGGARLALGRRLHEIGQGYGQESDLLREGGRVVRALRDETGDTVQLSVLDGDLMMVLLKEEGLRALRIVSQAGSRVPVNWAAAGRLLVSDLDDAALVRLLSATVAPSPTGRAETDVARLVQEIRAVRARGYATELGQANEHAGCVAAPVVDAQGRCVAALSVAAPEQRLQPPHLQTLVEAVIRSAADLSQAIARTAGASEPPALRRRRPSGGA